MARKTTKSNPTTAEEGMVMILDTPVLKSVGEAAEFLDVAEIRVLELFADALNLPEAMGWEVIPQEHEHLLNEFKAQITNVQALPEFTEEPTLEPQETPVEVPLTQDEPQPKKRAGRKKKESTALTQKKTEAIQENRQNAAQTHSGVAETLTILSAQEGAQDGANAATAYLLSPSCQLCLGEQVAC
jgi:hypothetical protein